MGKGDRKTKRGKILKGSFGVRRPKKNKNRDAAVKNKTAGGNGKNKSDKKKG